MPTDQADTVRVTIMNREYRVRCAPDRVAALKAAAAHLDQRMRALHKTGSILSVDNLAVTAALNLANDYFAIKNLQAKRLGALANKIEAALSE